MGFELGTFWFWFQCLNPLGNSPQGVEESWKEFLRSLWLKVNCLLVLVLQPWGKQFEHIDSVHLVFFYKKLKNYFRNRSFILKQQSRFHNILQFLHLHHLFPLHFPISKTKIFFSNTFWSFEYTSIKQTPNKPDNIKSHNSLKLSFINIWHLSSSFVGCESFLEPISL